MNVSIYGAQARAVASGQGGFRGKIAKANLFGYKVKWLLQKYLKPLKKRCRILPAGGLGVSPSFKKSPKIGGLGG